MPERSQPARSPRTAQQGEPSSAMRRKASTADLRSTEPSPLPPNGSNLKEYVGRVLGAAGIGPKNPYDTKTMQYFLSVYRTRNTGD
jgi:hypothetical protein